MAEKAAYHHRHPHAGACGRRAAAQCGCGRGPPSSADNESRVSILVDAFEVPTSNFRVAATSATENLYVDPKPANRLLFDATAMPADHADLAFCAHRLGHGFTRMPASRAAAMNARRAVSGDRLPELTSEHARSADRRLSLRLPGHRLSKNSPHDRMSEMIVCPSARPVKTVTGRSNF